jgi:hypothetical protein
MYKKLLNIKLREVKRSIHLVVASLFLAVQLPLFLFAPTAVYADSHIATTTWQGHGSEHLPCAGDEHWILSPTGKGGPDAYDVTSATLKIDGTQYPMTRAGGGFSAYHADTDVGFDGSQSDSVTYTFTGTPEDRPFLKLSHCKAEEPKEHKGRITIIKDVRPDNKQAFAFSATGEGVSNFELVDDGYSQTDKKTFYKLSDGKYTFKEHRVKGWKFHDVFCSQGADKYVSGSTLSVNLKKDQQVTCTFVNKKIEKKERPPKDPKVTLCHATGSRKNPFVKITVDAAGAFNGHYKQHEKDIIPEFTFKGETYSLNWDGKGQAIYENDCKVERKKKEKGSITIVKDTKGKKSPKFNFTSNFSKGNFKLVGGESEKFSNLSDKTYTITELDDVRGWKLDKIVCEGDRKSEVKIHDLTVDIKLKKSEHITCTFFNMKKEKPKLVRGTIKGIKFEDKNGNGKHDKREPKLRGWTIKLFKHSKQVATTKTDHKGHYEFKHLKEGKYRVCEELKTGWVQTYPSKTDCHKVELSRKHKHKKADFGNFKLGKVSGFKFNDLDNNGKFDRGEPKLSGWTITLSKAHMTGTTEIDSTMTAADGSYKFGNLKAGTYLVCETQQTGWMRTLPVTSDCKEFTISKSGEKKTVLFGNREIPEVPEEPEEEVNGVVLGVTTPPVGGLGAGVVQPQVLADTGSSMLSSLIAGIMLIGLVGATGWASRYQYQTSSS